MKEIKNKIDILHKQSLATRDDIQHICLDFVKHPTQSVFLAHTPRLGKTRSTLNMLSSHERALIVSNTTLIRDQWAGSQIHCKKSRSICWQSMRGELDDYDVIILDEFDAYDTQSNLEIFGYFHPKRWIFLTGTKDFQATKFAKTLAPDVFIWEISAQRAIDWGILPKPQIWAIGLTLDHSKRNCLYEKGKDKKKMTKTISYQEWGIHRWSKTYNLAVNCTEREFMELVNADQQYWKDVLVDLATMKKLGGLKVITSEQEEEYQRLWAKYENYKVPVAMIQQMLNVTGNKRKKFLADRKMRHLQEFLNRPKLEGKRLLIFVDSAKQAEQIHEEYSTYSKKGKAGLDVIKKFQEGEIPILACVNQLNRGIDLSNIDFGIILQCAGSANENKQKASRMFLDEFPNIVVFYFKGTQDEKYVKAFCGLYKEEYTRWINQ